MPHVMLRRDWPGVFHRTVFRPKGKQLVAVKRLEFSPGVAVELEGEHELKAVAADIGKALLPVVLDEKQRPKVVQLEEDELEETVNRASAEEAGAAADD